MGRLENVRYEVDLRNRKTGKSVECILSTEDYDEAYRCSEDYNKYNLKDYDKGRAIEEYIDGKTDGFVADVYHVEAEECLHGVGKFE